MGVEAARLASGTVASNPNDSANTTVIGQLYTNNEPDIKAVIKALSPKQIANELIASALIAALDLPAPRSFLVFADPADAFSPQHYRHSTGDILYFGSELVNSPTLIAFFSFNSALAFKLIHGYPEWGRLLAFDEWTANVDRHLKNYMYDGNEIKLFDHDRCLTGPDWTPLNLVPSQDYPCHARINQVLGSMPSDSKSKAVDKAKILEGAAQKLNIKNIVTESLAAELGHNIPNDLPAAEKFLKERTAFIKSLCDKRLS